MYLYVFYLSLIGVVLSANVDIINDENYDEYLKRNENVFLMYFRKPHSYCSMIRPRFQDAAIAGPKSVKFARIDCSSTGKLSCEKANMYGHPDFVFFKNGIPIGEHREDRDKTAFLQFVKEMTVDNVANFESMDDLEKFFDEDNLKGSLVGFFETDNPVKVTFLELANKLRQWTNFAIVTVVPEVFRNKIALYQPKLFRNDLESDYIFYDGQNNEADIERWVKNNLHGTLRYRKVRNNWQFTDDKPRVITYFRIDFKSNDQQSIYLRNKILQVAKQFKNKFNFYISSTAEYPQDLLNFGQEDIRSNRPIVTIRYNNKKFMMEDAFSVENMTRFLTDLLSNKVAPYIMSEDIPEKNEELVKKVVGKNIEKEIDKTSNDVLLMFYAPWCQMSKRLGSKLNDIAEKMAGEDIAFMKMDAINNDLPHPFNATDFPTLYFVPVLEKERPIQYTGHHDLNSIIKFIAQFATRQLKGYGRSGQPRQKEDL